MKIDRFVIAIIIVVVIAYFLPHLADKDSFVNLDRVSSLGIALIFFFYGLKLKLSEIRRGLQNWKLHLLIQGTTFLLFPLIILLFRPLTSGIHQEAVWLSFLFLSAIPSTVSSSVVMVNMAGGNVPSAIFNASISGIIGILITPLWINAFYSNPSWGKEGLSDIYYQLLLEIVLPLTAGLVLQKWGHKWADRHSKALSLFDKSMILVIIYKSFAHAFSENIFSGLDWPLFTGITICVVALFFIVFYITKWLCMIMGFDRADTITAQYCGTKKSLVHGTVFSKVLFPASMTGIILLPIMIFHAFQILYISIVAAKEAQKKA